MTLRRKSPMKRGGRVKPRNATRRNKEWARAYGSAERVAFVRALACLVGPDLCDGRIETAHVPGDGGMGRKASARFTVPLCGLHHRALHRHGVATFEAFHGIDLVNAAARVERAWQAAA